MNTEPIAVADLEAELHLVYRHLMTAADELGGPLGELVRGQIKRVLPPLRAALILTVATPPHDDPARRDQRVLLAGALEMLGVALNIHRLLVNAAQGEQGMDSDSPLDRTFVGSTILAGDYCFSRAAQMAAQTDHPRVVAIFANTLQTLSEELLRHQFATSGVPTTNGAYDEQRELLRAGAHAAAVLVDLPLAQQQQAIAAAEELAAVQIGGSPHTAHDGAGPATGLNGGRWPALQQWLLHQRSNGKSPTPLAGRYN
jgi:octaprenyl-diphosphate synthase